jgi:hypothetical protein
LASQLADSRLSSISSRLIRHLDFSPKYK